MAIVAGETSRPARESLVSCGSLFRVGKEGEETVEVALDSEIKAPPPVDPGLPDVAGLVILLRMKGGVAEILKEESDTAVNCPLDF